MPSEEEQENINLARSFVNPDDVERKKALNNFKNYLGSITSISELEMLKLWKGLYYAMWLCDKAPVQAQLAEFLSQLTHGFQKNTITFLYLRAFFRTVVREWTVLDYHRVNKFYVLIRLVVREYFELLKKKNWNSKMVESFLTVMVEELLTKTPNGPRFHMVDLFLDELAVVSEGSLTLSQFLEILSPFFSLLSTATDPALHERITNNIFNKYLKKYCVEVGKSALNEEGSEVPIYFSAIDTKQIQKRVFEIASSEDILPMNRKKVYSLHQEFGIVSGVKFVGDDVAESATSSMKTTVSKKEEKSRKFDDMKSDQSVVPSKEVVVSATTSSETAEKPLKKKKKNPEVESMSGEEAKEGGKMESSSPKASTASPVVASQQPALEKAKKTPKNPNPDTESKSLTAGKGTTESPVSILKKDKTATAGTKKTSSDKEEISASSDNKKDINTNKKAVKVSSGIAGSESTKEEAESNNEKPTFLPSKKFSGAKAGYVFQLVSR